MAKKERVNWTINPHCIKLLQQAKKLNNNPHTSLSNLVEYAITQTFQNKEEFYREKIRVHQNKMLDYKEKLDVLKGEK